MSQTSSPHLATGTPVRAQAARVLGSRWWQQAMYLLLLLAGLLLLDAICYAVALPVSVNYTAGKGTLHVGTQTVPLGAFQQHPNQLVLVPHDPVIHEYQVDGTDSTSTYTLDTVYLEQIANSPYYHFQAWMRDFDGTSVWRNVRVTQGSQLTSGLAQTSNGGSLTLPFSGDFTVSLELQRPETPGSFSLVLTDGEVENITLDRNNQQIRIVSISGPGQANQHARTVFFPRDPMAFAAMVVDFLTRTALWAVLLVIAAFGAQVALVLARGAWERYGEPALAQFFAPDAAPNPDGVPAVEAADGAVSVTPSPATNTLGAHANALAQVAAPPQVTRRRGGGGVAGVEVDTGGGQPFPALDAAWARVRPGLRLAWARLTEAIHPVGVVALGCSFLLCCWIALAQYAGLPHGYDATAYFFGAKIDALGRLSVPLPAAARFFPGPYMVGHAGHWFPRFEPGTSAMAALGLRLGVPWLIEPVMGTLALLGIGLIAARLFSRRVATIAVLLGALSPFYSFLAASYLSEGVALCFLVWGLWALLRFAQGEAAWNLPVAAAGFGAAALTLDGPAVLFAVVAVVGVLALALPRWRKDWRAEGRRWLRPALGFAAVALLFYGLGLAYNARLTGNAFVTPSQIFNPRDHWGFGAGISPYGTHTLAAGLVTLDQLLTALATDLYGWPFYLTLAFLAVPFVLRRARMADGVLLASTAVLTFVTVGYASPAISLGPRYLLYTLPFLLILTARGIATLAEATARIGQRTLAALRTREGYEGTAALPKWADGFGLGMVLILLVACSVVFYWPRQIALHNDYTGMPVGTRLDFNTLEHPPLHDAIVVTDNYQLYGYTLFALNDPLLRGNVLYAFASTSDQEAQLAKDFPTRTIYTLSVALGGQVRYTRVAGPGGTK